VLGEVDVQSGVLVLLFNVEFGFVHGDSLCRSVAGTFLLREMAGTETRHYMLMDLCAAARTPAATGIQVDRWGAKSPRYTNEPGCFSEIEVAPNFPLPGSGPRPVLDGIVVKGKDHPILRRLLTSQTEAREEQPFSQPPQWSDNYVFPNRPCFTSYCSEIQQLYGCLRWMLPIRRGREIICLLWPLHQKPKEPHGLI
jgi:hypothetical protein